MSGIPETVKFANRPREKGHWKAIGSCLVPLESVGDSGSREKIYDW
jgi:hypothetical protein